MDIDDDMEWDNCAFDRDGDCNMDDAQWCHDTPMEGSDYIVLRSLKTGQLYRQFFDEIDEDL